MIADQVLRKLAREWNLKLEDVQKHYVLGWILFGISKSSIGKGLVFKGGTSLSKIYFPSDWRLSEDLDFTLIEELNGDILVKALAEEVPSIVKEASRIDLNLKRKPHTTNAYFQGRMGYLGPVGPGKIKVEISKEKFVGQIVTKRVPNNPKDFDYEIFSVRTYSLETITAEKIRAILQRGYVRDYYDVWRLLKEKKFDKKETKKMFEEKCRAKGIVVSTIDQFFPEGKLRELKPHLHQVMRLSREPLPPLETIFEELRSLLEYLKIG